MIDAINFEIAKSSPGTRDKAYLNWGQEDFFFVQRLLEMNTKNR